MWSSPKQLDAARYHPAVLADRHSGYSLAISLRHIEYIAKHGFEKYREEVNKQNPPEQRSQLKMR
jgi:hypothetical protein